MPARDGSSSQLTVCARSHNIRGPQETNLASSRTSMRVTKRNSSGVDWLPACRRPLIAGVLGLFMLSFPGAACYAQDAKQIVEEVQRRSFANTEHYEGTLDVSDGRGHSTSKKWQYDRLGAYGQSKVVLRFVAPPEVKGIAILIVNHSDRASDQWLWRPAIGREQRVALQDRSTRFFGTDFSFEDLEERDTGLFTYTLRGEKTVDGEACWLIESRPIEAKASQYTSSLMLIRKQNYTTAQIDHYHGDEMVRQVKYGGMQNVSGVWVATRVEISEIRRNSRTVLTLEKVKFNTPAKDDDFTVTALRREP